MFKKAMLAGALMAAGLFVVGPSEAKADHFSYSYGPRVSVGYGVPYRTAYRSVPVYRSTPVYRSVPVYYGHYGVPVRSYYGHRPVYRSGYRGGFGVSPYRYGYGRRGISIGFGF